MRMLNDNQSGGGKGAESRPKTWPLIGKRVYCSGRTAHLVDCGMIKGKRQRRTFATRGDAETYAQQKRIERENQGLSAMAIPLEVKIEAAKCLSRLIPYDATLTQATEYYVQHALKYRTAPLVGEMVKGLLEELKRAGRRECSVHTLKCFLGNHFSERFGQCALHEITLDDLNEICLVPELHPRTRLNRIRMVRQLYNYAINMDWISQNLADRIVVPAGESKVPGYLSVEEARRVLEAAHEFGLLGYVAMGLFVGIRRAELLRLDWSAVNVHDREITIGAEIAKTRSRRVISYDDTLASWLELCACEKGPVTDSMSFETHFCALRQASGIVTWPHNGFRHTFASYHLAAFQDPVKTAYVMGHRGGTDMLDTHYKGLVSPTKAKEFWLLRPKGISVKPTSPAVR